MTTPQQVILSGSPHVNRFVPHPMSHGSKKTRDEPKQHLDLDPYPYPSGKSSKRSKAYANVKETLRKIAEGFRPSRYKSKRSTTTSDEDVKPSPKVKFADEPYDEIGFGSPFGEIIESLHPSEKITASADIPSSPNAPIIASTTVTMPNASATDYKEDLIINEKPALISESNEISPTLKRHKREVVDMIKELRHEHFNETKKDDDIIAPSTLGSKFAWIDPPRFNTAAFEEKFLRIVFAIVLFPFMILNYIWNRFAGVRSANKKKKLQ